MAEQEFRRGGVTICVTDDIESKGLHTLDGTPLTNELIEQWVQEEEDQIADQYKGL